MILAPGDPRLALGDEEIAIILSSTVNDADRFAASAPTAMARSQV